MSPPAPTSGLQPAPWARLGAEVVDGGVSFAVWSDHAQRIDLCLYDSDRHHELARLPLHGPVDGVFHGFLAGAGPGLVYGYRAHGSYAPEHGHRFNPAKLLLDPYAREIVGNYVWHDLHYGHDHGHPAGIRAIDPRDNAALALKARVTLPLPALRTRALPRPAADIVLYELHVKGATQQHPEIPPALRGRYAGLAHPALIEHLLTLGVTTVALLPVHYHISEEHLARSGRTNYWGYNTLGFFCPDPRYSQTPDDPAATIREFRQMVATLHAAGLEVVLDVVYNHTAEGGETGPTLSFRGLDNAAWYRRMADDPSRCENWSGCGNTLNLAHPRVTQFVLDSLRYWVEVMGVDGFRFDLATTLGRNRHGRYEPDVAFFVALQQDPTLAQARLIAEPWDLGPDGYQLGRFPGRFIEWNDRFRDTVRSYWLNRGVSRGEFARRFLASSDYFGHGQRRPSASVNYVAAHDGYTLADVVSYAHKHNEANGEANRDGRNDEPAANFGVEGETSDPRILALRRRVRHAMLATTLLAQGTPMLQAGDELGRTQRGNNNAYCQDNPLGWLDWMRIDAATLELVRAVLGMRAREALLRHDRWFAPGPENPDIAQVLWYRPDGLPMHIEDWHETRHTAFGCAYHLAGTLHPHLHLTFNPEEQALRFHLLPGNWALCMDSSGELLPTEMAPACTPIHDSFLLAPARSLLVLIRQSIDEPKR
jgi:glycogen operon protein